MRYAFMEESVIVTVIDEKGLPDYVLGRKQIYIPDSGEGVGNIRLSWLEGKVAGLVPAGFSNGAFEVLKISNPLKPEESATVMIEPYLPPQELIILGGGHISQSLAGLGRLMGYRVTVVDDRPDFVSARHFPGAYRRICHNFSGLEDALALGRRSSVVIVTRGHKHDLECLRQVINYPVAYLGMIGSRRKVQMARSQLLEEGFDIQKVDRVHMPIGLDIGAQTPEEIAVSIAAELIKVRRGGAAVSLSGDCRDKPAKVSVYEAPSPRGEILFKILEAVREGISAAVATVVRTEGSTPRKAGAKIMVYKGGNTLGTIGGGSGESEVRLKALDVIDKDTPCLYRVSLNAGMTEKDGMICGGTMEIFIEPVSMFKKAFKTLSCGEPHESD